MDEYREDFQHVKREAQQEGQELASDLKSYVQDFVQTGKERMADRLHHISEALHRAGSKLDEENEPATSRVAHQAADGLDRFCNYIHQHDPEDMVKEADRWARRHPMMFIGGALATGLLVARFLRSGREPESTEGRGEDSRFMEGFQSQGRGLDRTGQLRERRMEVGIGGGVDSGGLGQTSGSLAGEHEGQGITSRPLTEPPQGGGFGRRGPEGGD